MENDRDTILEIVVSGVGVGVFIGATIIVGVTFQNGQLSDNGGLAIVGVIIGFIVLMAVIGYWLSGRE